MSDWKEQTIGDGKLVLHCGGRQIERAELMDLPAPSGRTATHYPIPHGELVRRTIENVEALGVKLNAEAHAISQEGNRYFGLFGVAPAGGDGAAASDGYQLIIGLRNSHDQAYKASLALGTRVFVCDNLSFSGEVTIDRMHTKYIMRDLPGLMHDAVGRIVGARQTMAERIEGYKRFDMDDLHAHDLIIRAVEGKVISPPKIEKVIKEWRDPSHPEFEPRNAWSLFNAFTETLKDYNVENVGKRTSPLHGIFDAACGNLASLN